MDKQFQDLYKLNQQFSENPGNLKKQRFIEDEQIRFQTDLPYRPSNMTYFENIMYNRDFSSGAKPRVGYFCNMIPQELIYAFGAQPVRLDCGNAAGALIGEEVLCGDICPLAKSSFGAFLNKNSIANSCDILILPTSCDAKRKMGEILNDIKPVFMLNLPPEQNHERFARQTYLEFLRLAEFLRKNLKLKLSGRNLRKYLKLGQQRSLLVREIQKIRTINPRALSMCDFFLIIQSSMFRPVDLEDWIEQTKIACDEIKRFKPPRKSLRTKLVLTGAPIIWPNYKVLNLFEECGADILADTLCTGAQSCFDPVISGEWTNGSILRALANRYVYASACPCFISQNTRINRILELVDETGAEGVVNYSLRLCQLFDIENYRIDQVLKSKKIPYINIRTDYSLEDREQLRVRIEAFLEIF